MQPSKLPHHLKLLWDQGFFRREKTFDNITRKLGKLGSNPKKSALNMALSRAEFITRLGKQRPYRYVQKHPPPPITATTNVLLEDLTNPTAHSEKVQAEDTRPQSSSSYVDPDRLSELRAIKSEKFDLVKLIGLCEELSTCYAGESYFAVAMLVRAVLDHVPPIFGCKSFNQVASSYNGGTKSFKQSMEHLENSSRKIADAHLHSQIRKKEVLPNKTQVNFASDLDVLLAEIVRALKY
jgi:hypothetical protein